MSTQDTVEQIKNPSTGASITRKINIGEKYEGIELEVWASSGTLEEADKEELKKELKPIVEDLTAVVEEKAEEWKAQDMDLDELEGVLDQANRDLSAGDIKTASEKLRNILRELQSR